MQGAWAWLRADQVPACSTAACEAMFGGPPAATPHVDGELQVREGAWSGYIVENRRSPVRTGGGGWRRWRPAGRRGLDATRRPPISRHCGHDLLPAASVGAANASSQQESVWSIVGGGVQGPARLVSVCKATADSVRSSVGSVRPRTNDQRADAQRSRPLRSWLLHRSRVEDGGGGAMRKPQP